MDDFYYYQAAKRLLSQIGYTGHSSNSWINPFGLVTQYSPGLNVFSFDSPFFNFGYQYLTFYTGRPFSPEPFLNNNLVRQFHDYNFDRDFFFREFNFSYNYLRSWRFLTFRIDSVPSPFIEYDRLHNAIFPHAVRNQYRRLPMLSLRRVHNVYPNHLKSFFFYC